MHSAKMRRDRKSNDKTGKRTRRRRPSIARDSDGEARRVLASVKRDLEKGLIPARVFGDRGLYELELRRIFARAWLFIGHESELPNPGDFAMRQMGEDAFIFIRDAEGVIRVLFNACRHRGTQICRVEKGNAAQFICPY